MTAILPSLERLWLSVFDEVSGPFAGLPQHILLQPLLTVAEVLTPLKYLTHLHITLFSPGVRSNRIPYANANADAGKLIPLIYRD